MGGIDKCGGGVYTCEKRKLTLKDIKNRQNDTDLGDGGEYRFSIEGVFTPPSMGV